VVRDVSYRGNTWSVELEAKNKWLLSAQLRSGENVPAVGEAVSVGWEPAKSFLIKLGENEKAST
jgi:hypothetical protein